MKYHNRLFFPTILLLTGWLCLLGSCNDPTVIGSELLEEDAIETFFTDTVAVHLRTVPADSALTYSPSSSSQLVSYFIGNYADPIFGSVRSTLYAQVLPEETARDFSDTRIDSVVVVLPVDSVQTYGEQPQSYGFAVRLLTEGIDRDELYYSNTSFATESTTVGTLDQNYRPGQAFEIYNPATDTTQSVQQIRIPIQGSVGEFLLSQDTTVYRDDSLFLTVFDGISVEATTETNGILAFDLFDAASGIEVYYTQGDTAVLSVTFGLSFTDAAKVVQYEHNYAGTIIDPFLQDDAPSDSLVFAQGFSGVETEIRFPDLANLRTRNIAVNQALLEIPVVENTESSAFGLPTQILLTTPDDEGELVLIDDIFAAGENLRSFFGGIPVVSSDGTQTVYRLNISNYFQALLREEVENELRLSIAVQPQRANRVVLRGSESATNRPRLRLTYTLPQ